MIRVRRITHATFETPDLEAQLDHYARVLGLTVVERDGNRAFLSAGNDHHTVVLQKGTDARCVRLGFQLGGNDDLADFARHVEGHGIATARKSDSQPGVSDLLSFTDPKGTLIEVFRNQEASPQPFGKTVILPHKLGHIAFNVTDLGSALRLYCDVLGFRESDWLADFFAFLRCNADHHAINLVSGERVKMHHIAFELKDFAHIGAACDALAAENIPLIWGPVRHGIGHNISVYYRNPDEQIIELFTEIDKMSDEDLGWWEPRPYHEDRFQKPKVWMPTVPAANIWGIPAPTDFLD